MRKTYCRIIERLINVGLQAVVKQSIDRHMDLGKGDEIKRHDIL